MGATHRLTRSAWALAPLSPRRALLLRAGGWLLAAVLGAAASAGYFLQATPPAPPSPLQPASPTAETALAQARMALKLSEARSSELEREIDSLHQRLAEAQEALAFFRKARETKPPAR
jgi:hypothetical protein